MSNATPDPARPDLKAQVTDLIDTYLAYRVARDELAPSSVIVVRSVLGRWARWVDHSPPDTWTADQVVAWIRAPYLRPNTAKSRLTKLRPFVEWLRQEGHTTVDPVLGISRIKVSDGDPRNLEPQQVRALLDACPDDRARLMVILMVQCALRCGDLARIRVEDINRRRRILHVRAKGGRGEPTHWVPIPEEAWEHLVEWLDHHPGAAGPLVASYHRPDAHLHPHTISAYVRRWMIAAGLKNLPYDGMSSHALRHTSAQDVIDRGAKLREVQYLLGHRSERSTEIYLRREPPGLREAVDGRRYST